MKYNHEMMWKELKEKISDLTDADGLIILSDLESAMEELENEWQILVNIR